MNFNEIFEDVKNDMTIYEKIDINKILKAVENEKTDYLENKTFLNISKEILDTLSEMDNLNEEYICEFYYKLKEYMLIKSYNELRKSRYLRYIQINNKNSKQILHSGGILIGVSEQLNDIYLLLMVFGKKIIKLRMKDYIFFQKLTPNDKIILYSFECIKGFQNKTQIKV
jgi:hypothetical protein